jgi:hypothetical protein
MLYTVSYRRASAVSLVGGLLHVFLAAMRRKEAPKPWLFHGELAQPLVFREGLLTLRDVVTTRFYRPDLWRMLDPVVTVEQEWVRLEGFSSDAGVYARLDLRPDVFQEGEMGSPGTTNVDFGPEFAARLSGLRPGQQSAFEVGEESVTLHTEEGAAVERQVELPERWLRGFLQVQAIQRAAQPLWHFNKVQARQLLAALPAQRRSGDTLFVTSSGKPSPTRPRADTSTVEVAGLHRLRLLRRLAPHVEGLYVWAVGDCAPTFWMADLGAARMTLGLSSAVNQGFSGDGEALKSARQAVKEELVERARGLLATEWRFTVSDLARLLNVTEGVAGELVDLLSEQGLLGYDLPEGLFYPRHLPYVAQAGFAVQPRDVNARRVVEAGGVEVEQRTPIPEGTLLVGWVEGDHATYRVRVQVNSEGTILDGDCTCPWILQHGMQRGPCKHILALRLAEEQHE